MISFEYFYNSDFSQEIIDEDTGEILCDPDNENCVMNPMKGIAESMIMTFLMSVGELSPCWDALQYSNHEYIGKKFLNFKVARFKMNI